MSIYFISKNRLFSGLASCRPTVQWNGGGGGGGGTMAAQPKSFKSTTPPNQQQQQTTVTSNTTNTLNPNPNTTVGNKNVKHAPNNFEGNRSNGKNGSSSSSSSSSSTRKGKHLTHLTQPNISRHKRPVVRKSWRWKAGAGWTILSVLDWWLIAAGGWFTLRGVFLKWTPIGICVVAAVQWQMHQHRNNNSNATAGHSGTGDKRMSRIASQWQTNVYCSLPLRLLSRGWGWLADCRVPVPVRPLVYGCYSAAFGVNLQEAASPDFKDYRSLAEFFTRSLKENARVIDAASCLVSPADGRVLHLGPASSEQVEQVKGVTYSLRTFLGPANWTTAAAAANYTDNIRLKRSADTQLYQCIIYLAPGDYHRFHSPTEWQPELRRHFVGELLSVSPQVAHWLPGLFSLNERALYVGRWRHGFFSFTAVGATNVGSVEVYMDEALRTNRWAGWCWGRQNVDGAYEERQLPADTQLGKGELLGQFNMGSTVVLVFEAPRDFRFAVRPGQTIRMGESLGCVGGHQKAGEQSQQQQPQAESSS